MSKAVNVYKRKLQAIERRMFRHPNTNVVVAARVRGHVSAESLIAAARKVQKRHRLLNVRTVVDQDDVAWFTSQGAEDVVVRVFPRRSDKHWIQASLDEGRIPYAFEERSPIRIVLLHSGEVCDLVVVCHHMICDGMSLAYVLRDLLTHLGDPARAVEVLPDPPLMDRENIPSHITGGLLQRLFVRRMSDRWRRENVSFDREDYRNIFEAYWQRFRPGAYSIECTGDQTARLVARCRQENVTVNTVILAALLAAQHEVQGSQRYLHRTGTAVNVRGLLVEPPGEAMGLYAGGAMLRFRYPPRQSFWENARRLHREIRRQIDARQVLARNLVFVEMEPTFYEAMHFKRYGKLVPPGDSRYEKLSAFCARKDAMAAFVQSEERGGPKAGVILTNLGRLGVGERYGDLELERMMFMGAGSRSYQKGAAVVTASGRLTLTMSYVEQAIDAETMDQFRKALLAILSEQTGWG